MKNLKLPIILLLFMAVSPEVLNCFPKITNRVNQVMKFNSFEGGCAGAGVCIRGIACCSKEAVIDPGQTKELEFDATLIHNAFYPLKAYKREETQWNYDVALCKEKIKKTTEQVSFPQDFILKDLLPIYDGDFQDYMWIGNFTNNTEFTNYKVQGIIIKPGTKRYIAQDIPDKTFARLKDSQNNVDIEDQDPLARVRFNVTNQNNITVVTITSSIKDYNDTNPKATKTLSTLQFVGTTLASKIKTKVAKEKGIPNKDAIIIDYATFNITVNKDWTISLDSVWYGVYAPEKQRGSRTNFEDPELIEANEEKGTPPIYVPVNGSYVYGNRIYGELSPQEALN